MVSSAEKIYVYYRVLPGRFSGSSAENFQSPQTLSVDSVIYRSEILTKLNLKKCGIEMPRWSPQSPFLVVRGKKGPRQLLRTAKLAMVSASKDPLNRIMSYKLC